MALRATFLVDADGKIAFAEVNSPGDVREQSGWKDAVAAAAARRLTRDRAIRIRRPGHLPWARGARSSAVELSPYKRAVAGSNPAAPPLHQPILPCERRAASLLRVDQFIPRRASQQSSSASGWSCANPSMPRSQTGCQPLVRSNQYGTCSRPPDVLGAQGTRTVRTSKSSPPSGPRWTCRRQEADHLGGLPQFDRVRRRAEVVPTGRADPVQVRAELREVHVQLEDPGVGDEHDNPSRPASIPLRTPSCSELRNRFFASCCGSWTRSSSSPRRYFVRSQNSARRRRGTGRGAGRPRGSSRRPGSSGETCSMPIVLHHVLGVVLEHERRRRGRDPVRLKMTANWRSMIAASTLSRRRSRRRRRGGVARGAEGVRCRRVAGRPAAAPCRGGGRGVAAGSGPGCRAPRSRATVGVVPPTARWTPVPRREGRSAHLVPPPPGTREGSRRHWT